MSCIIPRAVRPLARFGSSLSTVGLVHVPWARLRRSHVVTHFERSITPCSRSNAFSRAFLRSSTCTLPPLSPSVRNGTRSVWSHLKSESKAREVDFSEIPVIDVSALTSANNDPVKLKQVLDGLREACRSVGFFYVKNHGVDEKLLERMFRDVKRFFDLPAERKEEIHCRNTPNRGWFEVFGENLGPWQCSLQPRLIEY